MNPQIKDTILGREHERCLIDREKQPRMPWRDIQIRVNGASVYDLARSFSQYWNFIKNEVEGKDKKVFLFPKVKNPITAMQPKKEEKSQSIKKEKHFWENKYTDAIINKFTNKRPFKTVQIKDIPEECKDTQEDTEKSTLDEIKTTYKTRELGCIREDDMESTESYKSKARAYTMNS